MISFFTPFPFVCPWAARSNVCMSVPVAFYRRKFNYLKLFSAIFCGHFMHLTVPMIQPIVRDNFTFWLNLYPLSFSLLFGYFAQLFFSSLWYSQYYCFEFIYHAACAGMLVARLIRSFLLIITVRCDKCSAHSFGNSRQCSRNGRISQTTCCIFKKSNVQYLHIWKSLLHVKVSDIRMQAREFMRN